MLILVWLAWWLIKGTPGFDASFNDAWFTTLVICLAVLASYTVRRAVASWGVAAEIVKRGRVR